MKLLPKFFYVAFFLLFAPKAYSGLNPSYKIEITNRGVTSLYQSVLAQKTVELKDFSTDKTETLSSLPAKSIRNTINQLMNISGHELKYCLRDHLILESSSRQRKTFCLRSPTAAGRTALKLKGLLQRNKSQDAAQLRSPHSTDASTNKK